MTHPEILLKQVPLFRSLPREESLRLVKLFEKRLLKKGEVLFRKGDEGTALFMIVFGRLKIVRQSPDGDEAILALLGSGDFCGEMALLDGLPRSADAVAVEETHLFSLDRNEFLVFVTQNETAARTILAELSRRLRRADDFIEDVFFLDLAGRLVKRLVELASETGGDRPRGPLRLAVTQKELAAMVGATRESVNKELRVLREQGLIGVAGRTLLIHDLEALRSRAM